jgi:hypothetical protein
LAQLASLTVADEPAAWSAIGFTVAGDVALVDGVELRFAPASGRGITSWNLTSLELPAQTSTIDGLPTSSLSAGAEEVEAPREAAHPNGVTSIDHVVVATPDHARTISALESAGLRLLRTRSSETYGNPMVQGFFRLGAVILEVVGPPEPSGDGPARWFGLAFTVADLDATAAYLGPRLHPAKDAVQEGRRIATLDRASGIGTRLAFMSP